MEFKRLSDVEVVAEPAESANVLIEENGVIKKAPKTAFGGGNEWDAVIAITMSDGNWLPELIEGSYDAVRGRVLASDTPHIKVIVQDGAWRSRPIVLDVDACEDINEDSNIFVIMFVGGNIQYFGISPDNTMFLD